MRFLFCLVLFYSATVYGGLYFWDPSSCSSTVAPSPRESLQRILRELAGGRTLPTDAQLIQRAHFSRLFVVDPGLGLWQPSHQFFFFLGDGGNMLVPGTRIPKQILRDSTIREALRVFDDALDLFMGLRVSLALGENASYAREFESFPVRVPHLSKSYIITNARLLRVILAWLTQPEIAYRLRLFQALSPLPTSEFFGGTLNKEAQLRAILSTGQVPLPMARRYLAVERTFDLRASAPRMSLDVLLAPGVAQMAMGDLSENVEWGREFSLNFAKLLIDVYLRLGGEVLTLPPQVLKLAEKIRTLYGDVIVLPAFPPDGASLSVSGALLGVIPSLAAL